MIKYITSDIYDMFRFGRQRSWDEIITSVQQLPKHTDLKIEKNKVAKLPLEFRPRLGEVDGQIADYGVELFDGKGIHVKEYDDHYKVHWDSKDPNKDPLGHLIFDAPHWLVIGAGVVDEIVFKGKYRKKLKGWISDLLN